MEMDPSAPIAISRLTAAWRYTDNQDGGFADPATRCTIVLMLLHLILMLCNTYLSGIQPPRSISPCRLRYLLGLLVLLMAIAIVVAAHQTHATASTWIDTHATTCRVQPEMAAEDQATVVLMWFHAYYNALGSCVVALTWMEVSMFIINTLQFVTTLAPYAFDLGDLELHIIPIQAKLVAMRLMHLVVYYPLYIQIFDLRGFWDYHVIVFDVGLGAFWLHIKVSDAKQVEAVYKAGDSFQDATVEDLRSARDELCLICFGKMRTHVKKLHCGHLFHGVCLRDWIAVATKNQLKEFPHVLINRSQLRCPLCRKSLA